MSSATWTCSRCGRRVPTRISQCHCGMNREEAVQLAPLPLAEPRRARRGLRLPWRDIWADLTWDLRALVIGIVVVLLAGVVWLVVPHRPAPIVPVLGIVAPAPTPPPPTPTPPGKSKRRWRQQS